ncbi:MAG: hypothetical protein Q9165_005329 [Trypethelium subeluteriae]
MVPLGRTLCAALMSKGLPPPERSLLSLVRIGGAAEVRLLIIDSSEEDCKGLRAGAALVSMAIDDIAELIVGAVETDILLLEEVEEVEELVDKLVDEEVVVEVDEVEEELVEEGVVDGESVEVKDTVETNDGLFPPAEVAPPAPPPPPFVVELWLPPMLGHRAFTPSPFLKADMISPPGSWTLAQAESIFEVRSIKAFAHKSEHGFPLESSLVVQPEIDCV